MRRWLLSGFVSRYLWLDVAGLVRRLRPNDDIVTVRYFTTIVRGEPEAAVKRVSPDGPVILAMPPGNLQPHKRFADSVTSASMRLPFVSRNFLKDLRSGRQEESKAAGEVDLTPVVRQLGD